MFNNSGHCAHIRPIIDCKGNGYKTDRQRIGLSGATMYGFAFYALAKQFMLRRFAIVHEMGIGNFKGLIGAVGADLRKYLLKNRRTP